MARAQAEAQVWKGKFGTEALPRIDDLDNARCKLVASIFLRFYNRKMQLFCIYLL